MAIKHRLVGGLRVPFPVMSIINNSLKAAGYKIKLVRGRGYYYFLTDNCRADSIYMMWLEQNEQCLRIAFDYTVDAIKSDDLDPAKFVAEFKRRVEKHQR